MKQLLFANFFFWSILSLQAQNAEIIYKNIANSTVTIETKYGLGSGFFVGTNLIVTNYHVIEGSTEAFCFTENSPLIYNIEGFIAVDKSKDLVLLKVQGLNRPSIKISVSSTNTGQNIFVIGSPKGLPATISNGIISGLREYDSNELIQITAPISPGSSGGPVLNTEGRLVGVSVSQINGGQNLNFAIPAKYVKKLIEKSSSIKSLSLLIDTEIYSSVTIGTANWMSSNLNVSRFRNGDLIPEMKTDKEWIQAGRDGVPAWCYYDNNPSNGEVYGRLYNYYAVSDPRGLAPSGWHIASVDDWAKMGISLGKERKNVGEAIRSPAYWKERNDSTASGFNALPAGYRVDYEGYGKLFANIGKGAFWWCAEELDSRYGECLILYEDSNELNDKRFHKSWGASVRCVKD